tara:strand:- start:829 stop:1554 length:726 start_codon:yes stop_codon:yes gene_type:complete
MSKTRLYINSQISPDLLINIKNKQHHYLKNVMRIKINDTIRIFDGVTGEWLSIVLSVNKNNTILRVFEKTKKMIKGFDLWLIFSPIKKYRINIIIQKATELGVTKIIPCLTDYSNIRSININNLQLNAIEAAEQSERLDVPKIEKPIQLNALLKSWPKNRNLIFCDEKLDKKQSFVKSLILLKNDKKKWAVIVGPEGGFSVTEKKLISRSKNVVSVSLGRRLLRSDTAITVALFCAQELLS